MQYSVLRPLKPAVLQGPPAANKDTGRAAKTRKTSSSTQPAARHAHSAGSAKLSATRTAGDSPEAARAVEGHPQGDVLPSALRVIVECYGARTDAHAYSACWLTWRSLEVECYCARTRLPSPPTRPARLRLLLAGSTAMLICRFLSDEVERIQRCRSQIEAVVRVFS